MTGAKLVSEKLAGVVLPDTLAVTMKAPPAPFAVNTGDVAIPCAFVTPVAVFPLPANVPLAPVKGAVKVTVAPLTKLPPASVTVAWNTAGYGALIVILCGVPAVAAILDGVPAWLVNAKLTVALPTPAVIARSPVLAAPCAFVTDVAALPPPTKLAVTA